MWSASVLLRAREMMWSASVSRRNDGLQVFYYVRGVCQEMMWSASVLLRARSVSR